MLGLNKLTGMQGLAAGLQAKDIGNGDVGMLIVGGGEIDLMSSCEEEGVNGGDGCHRD